MPYVVVEYDGVCDHTAVPRTWNGGDDVRWRCAPPALAGQGAIAWGFPTDLWTTGRIAILIRRRFGVTLHRAHVGRVLVALGWSCQTPI